MREQLPVKMMRAPTICATLAVVATVFSLMPLSGAAAEDRALIREQKTVMVDGKPEVWRLQWEAKPNPACGADDADVSLTCPCSGIAYGEEGPLALVPIRSDGVTERLELGPFFDQGRPVAGTGVQRAALQRWAPIETGPDSDWQQKDDPNFVAQVARRPETDVMQLADFDHDGQATEFPLQVGTLPCGKHQMVVIGISKTNPHLHVFSSEEKPDKPLILGSWEWQALRESAGPTDVIDWNCNDHGSIKEWRVHLSADAGLIRARKTSDYCPQVKTSPLYQEFLKLDDLSNRGKVSEQEYSMRFLELFDRLNRAR